MFPNYCGDNFIALPYPFDDINKFISLPHYTRDGLAIKSLPCYTYH